MIESLNRRQTTFGEIIVGTKFQLVNSVMKAALPKSIILTKISREVAAYSDRIVKLKPTDKIEIVQ